MRIRRLWLVLLMLLIPTTAGANDHVADLFLGGGAEISSTLWGPHVTFSKTIPPDRQVSVFGDFSAHWGSHDDTDVRLVSFMGGVRYHLFPGKTDQRPGADVKRAVPFAQVAFGGVHAKSDSVGDTDPAVAFGAGIDYVWPDSSERFGVRVQADYIVHRGDNTTRISAGLVIRWLR